MEIEEGVIRRDRRQRGITPSKTSTIFHIRGGILGYFLER